MNQQNQVKIAQYWADYHLTVSGNQYCLIENGTQKNLFEFVAFSLSEAKDKCAHLGGVA
jgi:hypothetical protein